MPKTPITHQFENLVGWEPSLAAFLAETEHRSDSPRTAKGDSRMLRDFLGRLGKTPAEVTALDVYAWAHSRNPSGRTPSAGTIEARLTCASSFFRFLRRTGIVDRNPCEQLERLRAATPPPQGFSAEEIRLLLASTPDTPAGLRNRALILTLVLTGRRGAEVFRLTCQDLAFLNGQWYYTYRGKGGKTGRRELPQPAVDALRASLRARDRDLEMMAPSESVWDISSPTFYVELQWYLREAGLPRAGVHVLRDTAARLRREAGESLEDVNLFLDYSSTAGAGTQLQHSAGKEDPVWGRVAEAIGVGAEGMRGLSD
ncbi:MAG: tyrosine-type recombinase/integrase [Thermoleophilia bacterium]